MNVSDETTIKSLEKNTRLDSIIRKLTALFDKKCGKATKNTCETFEKKYAEALSVKLANETPTLQKALKRKR